MQLSVSAPEQINSLLDLLIESGVTMSALINEHLDRSESFAYLWLMDRIGTGELARFLCKARETITAQMRAKYASIPRKHFFYSPKQCFSDMEKYKELLVWRDEFSNHHIVPIKHAAKMLHCSLSQVWDLTQKGILTMAGRGLILKSSLDSYLNDLKNSAHRTKAADMLGVKLKTVQNMLSTGILKYSKYGKWRGRISISSINAYINKRDKDISKSQAAEMIRACKDRISGNKDIKIRRRMDTHNVQTLVKKGLIQETGEFTVARESVVALIKKEWNSVTRHKAAEILGTTPQNIVKMGASGILKRTEFHAYDIESINHLLTERRRMVGMEKSV